MFFCMSGTVCSAEDNASGAAKSAVVQTAEETIVGRSKDYESGSSQMSILTFSMDPKELAAADKDRIAEACKKVERVKGVEFEGDDTIVLYVDGHYVGSVEKVSENAKEALKKELRLNVIEARVIN